MPPDEQELQVAMEEAAQVEGRGSVSRGGEVELGRDSAVVGECVMDRRQYNGPACAI